MDLEKNEELLLACQDMINEIVAAILVLSSDGVLDSAGATKKYLRPLKLLLLRVGSFDDLNEFKAIASDSLYLLRECLLSSKIPSSSVDDVSRFLISEGNFFSIRGMICDLFEREEFVNSDSVSGRIYFWKYLSAKISGSIRKVNNINSFIYMLKLPVYHGFFERDVEGLQIGDDLIDGLYKLRDPSDVYLFMDMVNERYMLVSDLAAVAKISFLDLHESDGFVDVYSFNDGDMRVLSGGYDM